MNDLDFVIEEKFLTYLILTQEIKRFNIYLEIVRDEGIDIPLETLIPIKRKIQDFLSTQTLKLLNTQSPIDIYSEI